jgi:hypothetical protein
MSSHSVARDARPHVRDDHVQHLLAHVIPDMAEAATSKAAAQVFGSPP